MGFAFFLPRWSAAQKLCQRLALPLTNAAVKELRLLVPASSKLLRSSTGQPITRQSFVRDHEFQTYAPIETLAAHPSPELQNSGRIHAALGSNYQLVREIRKCVNGFCVVGETLGG